jgi:5-oxoprolinase (ATP-hydrolysing)
MSHIQENAEKAVRQLLRKVAKENMDEAGGNKGILCAEDTMDDGTPIRLAVEIDYETVWPLHFKPPKI